MKNPLLFTFRRPAEDFPDHDSAQYVSHFVHVTRLAHVFSLLGLVVSTGVLVIALLVDPVRCLSVVGVSSALILLFLGALHGIGERKPQHFWPFLVIFGIVIALFTVGMVLFFGAVAFRAISAMGKEGGWGNSNEQLCTVYYKHTEDDVKYLSPAGGSVWTTVPVDERKMPKSILTRCRGENTQEMLEIICVSALGLVVYFALIAVYMVYLQAWRYLKAETAWMDKNAALLEKLLLQ